MSLPKWATTVTPLSKALALFIFITFPIIGFILGMQYQFITKELKRIPTSNTESINKSSNYLPESNIWISTDNNEKLFVKQDKKTYSGDLYYSHTFYDTYINKLTTKTIKVLNIGNRLPGVNFGSPLWSSDKFIIGLNIGDTKTVYLCFTDGSPAKELALYHSFQTEEYVISWIDNEKILGIQRTYKDTIQKPIDRVQSPENYTTRYWVASVDDLSKKTFLDL